MPNLNLNTIALVSTLRPAPLNGGTSSADYNDSQNETILDLTSISAFINNILIPMFQPLPDTALTGLEGRNIYGDSTDQTPLFYDTTTSTPLSISDGMRQLNSLLSSNTINVSNLAIQVGQLQQTLSSTNQNNIAITLQNLTNSINTLTNAQTTTDGYISNLQTLQQSVLSNAQGVTEIIMPDTTNGHIYSLTMVNGVLTTTLIS